MQKNLNYAAYIETDVNNSNTDNFFIFCMYHLYVNRKYDHLFKLFINHEI